MCAVKKISRKQKQKQAKEARKNRKNDDVAKAFREADAGPDPEEQARVQSAMLEALFEVYFRVLKQTTASGMATPTVPKAQQLQQQRGGGRDDEAGPSDQPPWPRAKLLKKCPLLYPVLEGLARWEHVEVHPCLCTHATCGCLRTPFAQ